MFTHRQWYRTISHAFVHADWTHLIVNMIVFWSFGSAVENYFIILQKEGFLLFPRLTFFLFFLSAVFLSSLPTLIKERKNHYYNAVGASGGVSAIVFASIFFAPLNKILFFMVLPIPGILFGLIYLIYSSYMSKKSTDNINHDAHFYGAVYGFIFPLLISVKLFSVFLRGLQL